MFQLFYLLLIIWHFYFYFKSIITHVVCHISIDRIKIGKWMIIAKGLKLKGLNLFQV